MVRRVWVAGWINSEAASAAHHSAGARPARGGGICGVPSGTPALHGARGAELLWLAPSAPHHAADPREADAEWGPRARVLGREGLLVWTDGQP